MQNGTTRSTGRITVHPRGFGFVNLTGPEGEISAFVAPPELNAFLDGDLVSATVAFDASGRASASSLTLIERTRTELFGSVTLRGKHRFLRVDRLVANTDWLFAGSSADDLPENAWVVAQIQGSEVTPVRTVPTGADLGLERCVLRHGLRAVFPEPVLAAARTAARAPVVSTRRDLRELVTVTIDSQSTTDIDDALSVIPADSSGALRVLVSIADVDAFVPEGSMVDEEARRRGTSVYLAGRVIPMLPDVLSSDAASLRQGQDRPVLTAELRIDPEGRITSVDLYEALVRSTARLTYDAVAEFLATGRSADVPPAVLPTLRWLRTAAARLSSVRAARGGIELARDEAYISFDPATREPLGIQARGDTEAHRLVERLMVAANEAVARWLVDRGQPGVFRVHDAPTPDRVEMLARFARSFGLEPGFAHELTSLALAAFEAQYRGAAFAPAMRTLVGNALGIARYTVVPAQHYGLAAPLYLHFTSPIRRYADLCVHRIVKCYLHGDRSRLTGDPGIESLAQQLNRAAYLATKAEAERHRMVVARWFAGRVGEKVTGNIVAVKAFGLIVQITGTGATGTVSFDTLSDGPYRPEPDGHAAVSATRRYQVGDPVEASITGTNEELGRVDLALS